MIAMPEARAMTTPEMPALNQWLSSPELQELREAWQSFERTEQAQDQAWWDGLNGEERARALRQVAKLMHQAEIKDRGSYRHAMYEVFGVDYCDGLAHYMGLHNMLHKGMEANQSS